jgi:UDP-N-acetylmuramyl pentapeptide phosphotransferase/UDP-N-acetylglucosamine-1-phosphate transferase
MISIFFIIILVNLFIYLNLNKISKIINLNDYPNKKLKAHREITPLLGGSIFYI